MTISFTFDDGPHPKWTPRVLDALDAVNVRATFFVQADCAMRWPELVLETKSRGHQIGAHSLHHRSHLQLNADEIRDDIESVLEALDRIGVRPTLWRPPYGDIAVPDTTAVAEQLGLHLVTWTVDTRDWTGRSARQLRADILAEAPGCGRLGPDAVILMHDTIPQTARLVSLLFEEICRRRWSIGVITRQTGTPEKPPILRKGILPPGADQLALHFRLRRGVGRVLGRRGITR